MVTAVLRRVAFFCGIFTVQCCVTVLGSIARDSIFLRSYRASSISTLTLILSLTTASLLTGITQFMARMTERNVGPGVYYAFIPSTLGAGLVLLALMSLYAPILAKVTAVLIYMWLELAAQVLTGNFWDLCAKAFDVSQSKQFFGFITFGSTFGTLLASLVVLPAIQSRGVPTEYNLIIGGVLLFIVAGILLVSAGQFISPSSSTPSKSSSQQPASGKAPETPKTKSTSAATSITSEIQLRTYLKHICFFDMLATVMRVLVDNRTLSILSTQGDETLVKASLTQVNSIQSFIMIPMQLASGPFFTRFGVMYGIALLPVSVFLFGAAAASSSSTKSPSSTAILTLVATRAFYNAVSLAVFNPARELLWLPFNATERSRFKGFVAGPFRSLSRVCGAVLSIVLTTKIVTQFIGHSSMSLLMMAVSIAWAVDAMAARKSYAAEFYSSLKQGYLDLSSPLVDFTPDQLELVKETLVSGAQNQINYVLSSLSHAHVGLFAQELRELFHKRTEDHVSTTPIHTKLRLLTLHTAAKRRFILQRDESLFAPDSGVVPPSGIFNSMDLLMMVKDKSPSVPRQLRVAALLACGYEKYNADAKDKCIEILTQVLRSTEEDRSVTVCAAVALLRLSDWMDEEANLVLQRLLHEDRDLASRVVCLKIVGRELPELLSDGYLVYLLHHSSPQIVEAAVECCSMSTRNSKMLIPALVKHLSNSALRAQVVAALKWFDPAATWATLTQYIDASLRLPAVGPQHPRDAHLDRREVLAGALKVLEAIRFPVQDKLRLLLHLIECLVAVDGVGATPDSSETGSVDSVVVPLTRYNDALFRLFGRDSFVEELVADALLALLASCDAKTIQSHSQELEHLHLALGVKIREAYEMRHVMALFHSICPATASKIEETSPLLLQHVEHSLKDTIRILLKLLSTGFPKEFNVSVILEGLESEMPQVHSAIQEVLENLLPSTYKHKVLPLLFPAASSTKSIAKLEKEVKDRFGGRDGVELLLDTMRCKQQHVELTCLALQYFLHIAEAHAAFLDSRKTLAFQNEILAHLLTSELARELLVEIYHGQRHVLPYESLAELDACEPPLLSKIAISNCLRVSSLFENVCAIGILRILSHHFIPVAVVKGETFITEGELATAMYVIATGTVQLHKERRVLADVGHGTCVGQAALLRHSFHEGNHIASATALTDCTLLRVARADLTALINETPRVSRGVLNAVASSLRWMYFEPLNTIAHSGSLPRRDQRRSSIVMAACATPEGAENMLKRTTSMTSSLKAAMSVDRAAKSFLYNVGRSRTSEPVAPYSLPGNRQRNRSFQALVSSASMSSIHSQEQQQRQVDVAMMRLGLSDASDYSTFEKSIHLKGSQLMKNLGDDKVSLVAQLAKVVTLEHAEVLYTDGSSSGHLYVIIEGTISITKPENWSADSPLFPTQELRPGDCFGEESFVENTTMHGRASAVGRTTLFQIPTKDLVDLSELHADLMQVLLAWLADKLARATDALLGVVLSPTAAASPKGWDAMSDDDDGNSDEEVATLYRRRQHKARAETD